MNPLRQERLRLHRLRALHAPRWLEGEDPRAGRWSGTGKDRVRAAHVTGTQGTANPGTSFRRDHGQ